MIIIQDNEDFYWAMGLSRYSLRIIGIWPNNDGKDTFPKTLLVPLQMLTMGVGIVIPQLYALKMVIKRLPLVVDNLVPTVALFSSLFKLFIMWRNKTNVADDWNAKRQNWEREIMLKMAYRGRVVVILGYGFMFFAALGIVIGPVVGIKFRTINNITDYGDRYLPFQTVYPYDVTRSPSYELSVLLQIFGTLVACICISSPVSLLCCIVQHFCAQLDILGKRMQNLHIRSRNEDESFWTRSKNGFQQEIAEIVTRHSHIIGTVARIEKFYKMLALVQLAALSVFMCCLGFQIMNVFDANTRLTLSQASVVVGTFFNVMGHSFIYCLSGQTLIHYSENILRCIAASEWYTFPGKKALDLQMIMIRTNDTLKLSAGKIIFLNLSSFCNILKSTAGYISMLIAIRDK